MTVDRPRRHLPLVAALTTAAVTLLLAVTVGLMLLLEPPAAEAQSPPPNADADNDAPIDADDLPWFATLQRTVTVEPAQVAAIGSRLGARLSAIHNQVLAVRGMRVQVNTVACASAEQAQRAEVALRGFGGQGRTVCRAGDRVFEILSDHESLRYWARRLVDALPAEPAHWRIRGRLALATGGDFMAAQPLTSLLLQDHPRDADVARLRDRLQFGDTLCTLADTPRQAFTGEAPWTPAPEDTGEDAGRARELTFERGALREVHGIPTVGFDRRVRVSASPVACEGAPAGDALTAAEAPWFPTEAPPVRAVLAEAKADLPEDACAQTRLEAIHRWVVEHLRYGGAMGSRRGTLAVLGSRTGRCWDFADVLVTLLRADGIPAREVAGWVVGMSGHIWVEAQVSADAEAEAAQWLSIDATAPWLGVDERYIALWPATRPVVYTTMPVVTEVAGE